MENFKKLFPATTPVIAMIHLQALPGTPGNHLSPTVIIDHALSEAQIYLDAGVDGIMLENMHDVPYLNQQVGPEITAVMTVVAHEIRKLTTLPIGIQVLAAANKEALAIAQAAQLDFIRAEGFVFGHLADEGWIDAQAGALLRYRKQIGAEHVLVFTDIKKKHSAHEISKDVSLLETAKAAEYFRSDGLIVTGRSTAIPADENELRFLRDKCDIPVLVGSGITIDNVESYLDICDGMIVGSYFKEGGYWGNALDERRVKKFMGVIKSL